MKLLLRTAVLFVLMIGIAQGTYADGLPPPTTANGDPTISVRGSDSIVENIDISPQATSFWRNLREAANSGDLHDYDKVASQLSLEGKYRRALSRPMQFSYASQLPLREAVQVTTYRVRQGGSVTRWTFLPDLRLLCLSRREVERNFGPGEHTSRVPPQVVDAGYSGAFETATSRLGYFHSMRYKVKNVERYVEVSFSPGGCADFIGLMQPNSNDFGLPDPPSTVSIE
ncbi:hypothetical protein LBW59_08140 [Ralstonia solanacearum]|uniref:Uncharacterized protein n=1 Tax=Ralstonia solanacearum TaxID=305 RepID=A0AAW5ZLB9_RALSL|nr:hypothetical protein [Ralstonia solanacearum]MDB0570741.1 hypothetical protein [Ralstonia solanacearum]